MYVASVLKRINSDFQLWAYNWVNGVNWMWGFPTEYLSFRQQKLKEIFFPPETGKKTAFLMKILPLRKVEKLNFMWPWTGEKKWIFP